MRVKVGYRSSTEESETKQESFPFDGLTRLVRD